MLKCCCINGQLVAAGDKYSPADKWLLRLAWNPTYCCTVHGSSSAASVCLMKRRMKDEEWWSFEGFPTSAGELGLIPHLCKLLLLQVTKVVDTQRFTSLPARADFKSSTSRLPIPMLENSHFPFKSYEICLDFIWWLNLILEWDGKWRNSEMTPHGQHLCQTWF